MEHGRRSLGSGALPAVAVVAAAAIAAVLAGSGVAGDVAVKVQEPITVESVYTDSSQGMVYNDNLSFQVTATSYLGDSFRLFMLIQNHTGVDQSHRITMALPDGFRLSRDASALGAGIALIQEGPGSFVVTLAQGVVQLVVVQVEILPQVAPGWYTISGATEPLETGLNNVG